MNRRIRRVGSLVFPCSEIGLQQEVLMEGVGFKKGDLVDYVAKVDLDNLIEAHRELIRKVEELEQDLSRSKRNHRAGLPPR